MTYRSITRTGKCSIMFNFHSATHVERKRGETANDRNDRAIREACYWYASHLSTFKHLKVVLLTNDRMNKKLAVMDCTLRTPLHVYTGWSHSNCCYYWEIEGVFTVERDLIAT